MQARLEGHIGDDGMGYLRQGCGTLSMGIRVPGWLLFQISETNARDREWLLAVYTTATTEEGREATHATVATDATDATEATGATGAVKKMKTSMVFRT